MHGTARATGDLPYRPGNRTGEGGIPVTQSAPRASGRSADLTLGSHSFTASAGNSSPARSLGWGRRAALARQWEEGRTDEAQYGRVAPPPVVDVLAVDPLPDGPDGRRQPAHAEVAVGLSKRWLLAEAWWAPEVTPPRFKEFVRWVLPMFPWLAAEYAVAAATGSTAPTPAPACTTASRAGWSGGRGRVGLACQSSDRGRLPAPALGGSHRLAVEAASRPRP